MTLSTSELAVLDEPAPATLPLSRIAPGSNPRRWFSPEKHAELVASLRQRGLLQPLLLRPAAAAGRFIIVAGERRYRAALEAFGADGEVPVVIRAMSDQEALEAAIDENDNREAASETEQADAAVRVLAACQGDRAEAARRLAWSPSKLDRRLALAGLSDTVKAALDERRIKVGHAELLAAVPGDKQDKALDTILNNGLDVGKTRDLLMRITQSLAAATFDKTECAACAFNSARQCALFETHVDDGYCTNPPCFELKTEAADKARRDEEERAAASAPSPAPDENPPAGSSDAPAASPDPATPARPTATAGASAKPKVTPASLRQRLAARREAAWRTAVASALQDSADHVALADIAADYVRGPLPFAEVTKLAGRFEADLRGHWQVDWAFLDGLSKDELKFLALECGLVAHMGEKAFADLLKGKPDRIVAGMLSAPGFDWAGRLPGAMTLDGAYAPPPAAAEPPGDGPPGDGPPAEPSPAAEEDHAPC